jgi:hypothetical protein
MSETILVGHANIQSRLRGLRVLAQYGAVGFGTCETNGLEDAAVEGYTPFFGGKGHPDRRAGDTCVWRRNDRTHLGVMGMRIAKPSSPDRIAGLPRFASCQMFASGGLGKIALWELHPHYIGEAASDPTVDRVAKVAAGMDDLVLMLPALEMMGYANIVVGDFNVPRQADTAGWTDPWDVLERLGMSLHEDNIDGAGVSPRLQIVATQTIPAVDLRSDHNGFVLELAEAPRSKRR